MENRRQKNRKRIAKWQEMELRRHLIETWYEALNSWKKLNQWTEPGRNRTVNVKNHKGTGKSEQTEMELKKTRKLTIGRNEGRKWNWEEIRKLEGIEIELAWNIYETRKQKLIISYFDFDQFRCIWSFSTDSEFSFVGTSIHLYTPTERRYCFWVDITSVIVTFYDH